MLKGTQVDGVYSADPKRDANAQRYDRLTYHDVLARDLQVMDASADKPLTRKPDPHHRVLNS